MENPYQNIMDKWIDEDEYKEDLVAEIKELNHEIKEINTHIEQCEYDIKHDKM